MRKGIAVNLIIHMNTLVITIISILYIYQMGYIGVVFIGEYIRKRRRKNHAEPLVKTNRYAAIISARNESGVIGQLLDTIRAQTYPAEFLDAIVIADNCTDDTAQVARDHGAIVYERFNKEQVGKGYALDYLFDKLKKGVGDDYYDAYVIIDADNLLDEHFFEAVNKTFCQGYRIMTTYRNSKNFATNWISAGYSLWFMREAKFLNNARMMLGTSCAVSGTGFVVASAVIRERGGWPYHLLTEDIEFTVDTVIHGEMIGYCGDAMLYDEQPTTFSQSWTQRMRWAKGYIQVFRKYGADLIKGALRGNFSCFDMAMAIMPAVVLTAACILVNSVTAALTLASGGSLVPILVSVGQSILNMYLTLFAVGAVTTATEWKMIAAPTWKKIIYTFTFPLFMFTYIPISFAAIFAHVEWKPIEHSVSVSCEELWQEGA